MSFFALRTFKSYKSEKQISFVNQCSINLFISFFAGLNVGGRNEVHLNVSKFISSPNLFEIVFNLQLKWFNFSFMNKLPNLGWLSFESFVILYATTFLSHLIFRTKCWSIKLILRNFVRTLFRCRHSISCGEQNKY